MQTTRSRGVPRCQSPHQCPYSKSKPPEYLARQIAKAHKAASDPHVADGRRHRPLILDLNHPHDAHRASASAGRRIKGAR